MVNSPDIANSDSMGSGFRGGLGSPAPMGGAPPSAFPGGAPPIDGADAGLGAPPGMPTASSFDNAEKLYRYSSKIINDLHERRMEPFQKMMSVRIASKQVLSDVHLGFLESMRPVTGRGDCGTLPDYNDIDIFPMFDSEPVMGGYNSVPMNRAANSVVFQHRNAEASLLSTISTADSTHRRTAAKSDQKTNQPTLFTKLEQKLYSIVLSGNIPYAFFAQYQAGPGAQYQLDGAFPALRLGIEADSSTFHSAPDKVATDRRRDMELATQGWTILRFTEDEIANQQSEILSVVYSAIRKLAGGQTSSEVNKTL